MSGIIRLLMTENTVSRRKGISCLHLKLLMQVSNLAYHKQVDIVWRDASNNWHNQPAHYLGKQGADQEYWQGQLALQVTDEDDLPDPLTFALRLRCLGHEYWDNHHGRNYTSKANIGISLAASQMLQNINVTDRLDKGQQWLPIRIAVSREFDIEQLSVHWTTDNWRHSHETPCRKKPSRYPQETEIWTGRLKAGQAFRVQFAICATHGQQLFWDNNCGNNYTASRDPLKILILNLHCYQETHQQHKFSQIAKAIDELGADIVCFQEVAEHWNNGEGDWASNSANIINQQLRQPFHLYNDWSHRGFDNYREGIAILSRFDILDAQARYVSHDQNIYSIHSRKVVMVQIDPPYLGNLNIFSAHLSWWEDGFADQFQQLCLWAKQLHTDQHSATLLCGDFNITAGSEGYKQVVQDHEYEDQFLAANAQGLFQKFFRVDDPHWRDYPTDDYRIDYIFMNKNSKLQVTSARVLFTDNDYGKVSDHCGYLMTFEPQY